MTTPAHDEMAPYRASAVSALNRIQQGLSRPPLELVHVPHSQWPVPRTHPTGTRRSLKILVLDASYNPPTLAHLALANSPASYSKHTSAAHDTSEYDAKLLLLSVRNADKALKPWDATYRQRLEMIKVFAAVVNTKQGSPNAGETLQNNVAIAIIDEPTFVGKSTILQTFFRAKSAAFAPDLSFDTQLNFSWRLALPRYYQSQEHMLESLRKFLSPAPQGDDSRIICAKRGSSSSSESVSASAGLAVVQEFISSGRIAIIDINEDVRTYSSSEVRNTIHRRGLDAQEWGKFVPDGIANYIVDEKLYADLE
ncbi:hypothetical protein DXG03_001684 [Asterophora parasitica]|uniref:Nicotinamide-nucleotide adenylyltransferase n=1 Tax=Asterophora parasitica TaxID=117018 RepID=A0A9P7KCJ8_9AGAR|nr:hypothetical protein DXG03_001684 [Asterophora parasitica]